MLGNAIEKNESGIANVVKKLHNFMKKTKNYLKKAEITLKRYIQVSQRKGKKKGLLGMWVFQLDLFCEILDDVCSSLENKDEVINKTFVNIKNLMSDRCNTQKKLVSCLWNLEKTFWNIQSTLITSLRWNEQEKMVEVNQFFCGLHYLVGLDDQAEACLKIWESIIHKDKKVGSTTDGG